MAPCWSPRRSQKGAKRGQDRPSWATLKDLQKRVPGIPLFWGPKMAPKLVKNQTKIGSVFGLISEALLGYFWDNFGGKFGRKIGPRGAKMGPRGPSRAVRKRKRLFSKKWFSHWIGVTFSLWRPPGTAPRSLKARPSACRRGSQTSKGWGPKLDPKSMNFWKKDPNWLKKVWGPSGSFSKFSIFSILSWILEIPKKRWELGHFLSDLAHLLICCSLYNSASIICYSLFRFQSKNGWFGGLKQNFS